MASDSFTPASLRERSFSFVRKGYSPDEVRAFLNEAAFHLESLLMESAGLRKRLDEIPDATPAAPSPAPVNADLTAMLQEMKRTADELIEHSKTNAAVVSHRAEQERRVLMNNAQSEASVVIRDAERRAERLVQEARDKVRAIQEEVGLLQARRLALISRLKALLVSHTQFLEALERDALLTGDALGNATEDLTTREGISADRLQEILETIDKTHGSEK